MKTPEEWIEDIEFQINDNCNDATWIHKIKQIQLDALAQGRKEGREQGIRESAEVAAQSYASSNFHDYFLTAQNYICRRINNLLTHPSPKEQEK